MDEETIGVATKDEEASVAKMLLDPTLAWKEAAGCEGTAYEAGPEGVAAEEAAMDEAPLEVATTPDELGIP